MVEDTLKANVPEPDEMAERVVFFAELGRMFDEGITLVRALGDIHEMLRSEKLRRAVEDVRESIASGTSLQTALSRHPDLFPAKVLSLVRDGECTGSMEFFTPYVREWLETGQFRVNPYAFIGCLHDSHWFGDAMALGAEAVLIRPDTPDSGPWKGQRVVWVEFLMPDGTTRKVTPNLTVKEAERRSIEPEPYRHLGYIPNIVRDLKLRTVLDDIQSDEMRGMLRARLRPQDKHEVLLPITFYPGRDFDEVRVEMKPVSLD